MSKKQDELEARYLTLILGKINELFNDEEISVKELQQDSNMTTLIHVVANLVPNYVYSEFTGENVNMLDFNHIANKLCFQFSKKV